jgi:hypothetical protein
MTSSYHDMKKTGGGLWMMIRDDLERKICVDLERKICVDLERMIGGDHDLKRTTCALSDFDSDCVLYVQTRICCFSTCVGQEICVTTSGGRSNDRGLAAKVICTGLNVEIMTFSGHRLH